MVDLDLAKNRLRTWAEGNPLVRALLIFGSYAKGTAQPGSDLDLAVVISPARGDADAFTTWIACGDAWTGELRRLLGFDRVQLEWLDVDGGETPTVAAGVDEARIVVYGSCR
ncbi:MAG: nucleotidyltransferase family protein [Vicinamibacteria bacterium]